MKITRRSLLQGALAVAGVPRVAAAAAAESAPILRAISSTGERIPVVGIGTNACDVESAADLAARKAELREFPGLGGRVIDTARGGQAAAGLRAGIRRHQLGAVHAQVQLVAALRQRMEQYCDAL
jgi:hypothetical protein